MKIKSRNFLYPDWRKLSLFFLVILIFVFLWTHILINSVPIMVIGTNDFQQTFCSIRLTAENCSLTDTEIFQNEATLNQTIDRLNEKYSQFANLNKNIQVANTFLPADALSCVLDKDVVNLINQNSFSTNNFLGITGACNSEGIIRFAANLVIVYFAVSIFFWFYDKRK